MSEDYDVLMWDHEGERVHLRMTISLLFFIKMTQIEINVINDMFVAVKQKVINFIIV